MKNIISVFVLSLCLITGMANAQDITNTLAPNGSFKIKDGSIDYLSLSQSTGYLYLNGSFVLPHTINSTNGVIYKDIERFLHNYQADGTDGVNTFLGLSSGNFTMSGTGIEASYNTGIGVNALYNLTTGNSNVAMGVQSLYLNTSGNNNTAIGNSSLRANTGNFNTAVGSSSLYSNSTGIGNTAVGSQSLLSNTTGDNNTALGDQSLKTNSTGYYNTAVGYLSLESNTSGYYNTAVGMNSLQTNTTGRRNTSLGSSSMFENTTGDGNTAVGIQSLYNNTTGSNNTALGFNAGSNVTTGANLTLIGVDAQPSSPTAINQITLGNQFVSSLRCNVQTITSLSDVRDKKNITDLTLGLDFITKLKPRQFNWDKRNWYEEGISDGSKIQETPTAGFIAQEFDEIQNSENAEWLNLILKDNPDKWEATYGNLLPVIVKAVQELRIEKDEEITELKIENEKLEIKNASLEERLTKYEEFQTQLVKRLEQLESGDHNSRVQIVNAKNNNQ